MGQEISKGQLEINDDLTKVKTILIEMIKALKSSPKKSRERALVITKLEEAESWAIKAGIEE